MARLGGLEPPDPLLRSLGLRLAKPMISIGYICTLRQNAALCLHLLHPIRTRTNGVVIVSRELATQRERPSIDSSPRYNIAPSQQIVVVRNRPDGGGREFARLRWGFIPSWSKDTSTAYKMTKARSETAVEKPAFREAFRRA